MIVVGESLLREQPYALIVLNRHLKTCCSYCVNDEAALQRCSVCKTLYYCNRKCQTADWAWHKVECGLLRSCGDKIPVDTVRLMLRVVVSNDNAQRAQPHGRTYADLVSHFDRISADPAKTEHMAECIHTLHVLARDRLPLPDAAHLALLYAKISVNTFYVLNCEWNKRVAMALYLEGSKFDHSCEANCIASFEGQTLVIKAIDAMSNMDAARISYIDQLNTTEERQSQLRETYYFECDCARCSGQWSGASVAEAGRCSGCGGDVLREANGQQRCSKCSRWSMSSEQEAFDSELLRSKLDAVHLWAADDWRCGLNSGGLEVFERLQQTLQRQRRTLCGSSVFCVKTLDRLFDAAIELQKWPDALRLGLQLAEPFGLYYGRRHPLYGVLLLKLAKLFAHLDHLPDALRRFQQALDVFNVALAPTHHLTALAALKVAELSQELLADKEAAKLRQYFE